MASKVVLIYPSDPLGPKVGGIETFRKDFISYAPKDIEISIIGVSSDPYLRPARRWTRLTIGDREVNFFPLFHEKYENKRKFISLRLRFAIALKFFPFKIGRDVLLFNNIESVRSFVKAYNPKICVMHDDPEQQIINGMSESLWSRMPSLYLWYEKRVFSALSHIYVVGAKALIFYRSRYPDENDKFERIRVWANNDIFSPASLSKRAIKEKIVSDNKTIPADNKWVLFSGRLQKVKAPLRLIDTFAEYEKMHKDACLLIIGDGNMRGDIDLRVKKLGIENKVFLIREVSPQDLADFYRSADAFLLTSDSETGPRSVIEALQCGLPVVSTDAGDVREFIKDGFSGEVVKSFGAADLALALEKVLQSPYVYTKENCVSSVINLTPQSMLKGIYDMIRKLYSQSCAASERVNLSGVSIDNVYMKEAIERVELMIKEVKPSYVVTPNTDHIIKLQKDGEFKKAYDAASLVVADGMPLIWASRFLRTPLKERVNGPDLFLKLCEEASVKKYRLFFLGGRPKAALLTAEKLKKQYPALEIAGICSPPLGFELDEEANGKVIKMIRDSRSDILFVALGAPKQEKWMYKYKESYQVPVSMGIGICFEFIAGIVKRAPIWMQRAGLEWFWRLMMEPRKLWKRYLVDDMAFFPLIIKQKFKGNMVRK